MLNGVQQRVTGSLARTPRNCEASWPELDLAGLDDFPSLVLSALGTYAMGQLGLLAMGANRQRHPWERVVRASLVATGLGMSTLRIRHDGSTRGPPIGPTARDSPLQILLQFQ